MPTALQRAARARLSGSRARSFFSRLALLLAACIVAPFAQAQESVCAEVKIEIKQTVTLERQAFDAVLKIRNGLSMPVEAIDVELRFADANGVAVPATTNPNDTSARFFFREDGSTDISGGLGGTGVVAPQKTGEAHWLIVPSAIAGGQTPDGVAYRVGAKITYRIGEDTKSVEVTPDVITVRPQPKLRLDYFLPGPVYGDDPQTPAVEPIEPFTLGVRVWNYGYGAAKDVAIESGQPKIIENRLGLLIDFLILGGYVDEAPAQPSLALAFGTITPGHAGMGRWNMTVSLAGQFDEFSATIHHADELGGALTSLISPGDLKRHRLVRDVLVDLPGRDGVRDYLAYENFGDVVKLFESDGGLDIAQGGAAPVVERTGALSGGGNTWQLSMSAATNNFIFAKIPDPFQGSMTAISARREDGKALPAANAWYSKERDASGTQWHYFLNVFDYHDAALGGGQVRYTLEMTGVDSTPAAVKGAAYEDVNGDGARGADEPAMVDVEITLAGTAGDGAAVTRTKRTDALGGFAFSQVPPGSYRLGIGEVAGYRNGLHTAGSYGGAVTDADIVDIPLGPGARADGYAFAKILRGVVTQQADLVIAPIEVDPPRAVYTKPITVRVQVRNLGPDEVPALVRIPLPYSFVFNGATPSIGQFDDASGVWRVGLLPVGAVQTLELVFTAPSPTTETIHAAAVVDDPQAIDPQPSNNYASREIDVKKPADYRVDAAVDDAPRVLVLSTCVTDDGGGPVEARAARSAKTAGDTCLFGRAIALDALFTSLGVAHLVVHDVVAFNDQLRSGHWNTYWVDAGAAALLGDPTNRELAQVLLRGEWVIVDQPRLGHPAPNTGADKLEAYVPAALDSEGPVGQPVQRVEVADSTWLPAGLLAAGPTYDLYRSLGTDAQVLAAFDMSPTLRPAALLRINRTLLFGFDFFSALSQASPEYRTQAMTRLLAATRPSRETVFETGRSIVFKGGITAWDPIDATLKFRTPSGTQILSVEPEPDVTAPTDRTWRRQLLPQQSFGVTIGVQLPSEETETPLGFDITSADRDIDDVRVGGIAVTVRKDDTQAAELRTALGTLGAADAAAMRALLDQARLDHASRKYGSAIRKLLDIADAVDDGWRAYGVYDAPLARELGRLILWWQRDAFESPVQCAPDPGVERAAGADGDKKPDASPAGSSCPDSRR